MWPSSRTHLWTQRTLLGVHELLSILAETAVGRVNARASALKRRLGERRERHWREQQALTERLTRLINGVQDRLDDRLFESVVEYADQTE